MIFWANACRYLRTEQPRQQDSKDLQEPRNAMRGGTHPPIDECRYAKTVFLLRADMSRLANSYTQGHNSTQKLSHGASAPVWLAKSYSAERELCAK